MKYILSLILIQFGNIGFAQTTEYKEMSLRKAFGQEATAGRKDSCTTQNVKVEIIFSGNVQRVLPSRAKKLNELIRYCGMKSKQDWTKGTTELSVFEEETRYWVQLEPAAADKILSKYRMGDKLILFGQVISQPSATATAYLIVSKLTFKK